ncbi:MAG: NAD(P)/FAD-dependent oxidoreductase [Myxococcales bacterium]|nr:NAD(P)/FAD-dependent oxidoreductase [Myxococcales bacterium]
MSEEPWNKGGQPPPAGGYDDIVIGSGMGGMTSAAMLAAMGRKVLVLEQHYTAGGFTHMFKRKRWTWDVGVHAVGEVTGHTLTGRLLSHLTHGRLEWASLGPVYDTFQWPGDFHIDFPDNPRQFRENLVQAFPGGVAAIDAYLRAVKEVSGSMRAFYQARALPRGFDFVAERVLARKAHGWFSQRTADVLASFTDDPRLRALFAAQWGYYGSPPSRSSFAIQALVTRHFMRGGYYPVGGAKMIAHHLLGRVAEAGGWTRIRADVEAILVEGGAAVGVRLADGEVIRARRVFSAVGVAATLRRLLPPEIGQAPWARSITDLRPAPAHVCLYVGFKGDIRAAGASAANQWFYETWDPEDEVWDVHPARDVPRAPCLYVSFPSLKDPTHDPGPDQLHTGEIVTFAPWDAFAPWQDARWRRRGDDYEAFKAKLTERLLDQFLAYRPELRAMVAYTELSTPISTDHFVRPVRGSIYGIEPTPERFANRALRPRSPVKNLYFSGSEVATVGVIGAMMGGVSAVMAAEPRKTMAMMKGV